MCASKSSIMGKGLSLTRSVSKNEPLWDIGPATVTMQQFHTWVNIKKIRHVYEFLAIGRVEDSRSVTAENKDIMWVDLTALKDPFLLMNSANNIRDSNISVHPHSWKPNFATVKADKDITGGEITDFYAVEGNDITISKRR